MTIKVTIHYDPIWTALPWTKKHCHSYITNDVHLDERRQTDITKIDYFFSDEQDATLFRLKWADQVCGN